MIKPIIIDDKRHSCDALKMLLDKCCPQVQEAAICHSGAEAMINRRSQHLNSVPLITTETRRQGGIGKSRAKSF